MTVLKFQGLVERGDDCRVSDDCPQGAFHIGGVDVVARVHDEFPSSAKVIVGIADETFTGELFIDFGWGYSEWTPMESDTFKVGDRDVAEEVRRRFDGQEITMWVSDEPINILDEYEVQKP